MNNFVNIFVPMISIAAFGFSGSLHCLGMCSPLVASCQKKTWQYFVSRGISYTIIGLISGYLGTFLLKDFFNLSAKKIALIVVTICFIQIFFLLKPINIFTNKAQKIVIFINRYSPLSQAATLGIITALLPCGFLYSAILMSATFANPWLSAAGMLAFACATSPILIGSKGLILLFSKRNPNFYKYFTVFILCIIAFIALLRGGYFHSSENKIQNTNGTEVECH
ncbi:sulfite exporter TauE/SafE family protein [Pigmentibacter sp. JX0631]|uniref:sulfite exporter TauE/SafE family protein n=1 Tax=Pigmentibacter sp. JX0631 TaxID=2976982 RepID=UPI00246978EB|nr:sulfite exporter TauE/SafE family protein [Pigmentibacter sp. JX0631]WGL59677.1 sulfite exporter TauE/SafE family protein [Pigmentibacter sp. JX0631]